jgi:hypothetical protein
VWVMRSRHSGASSATMVRLMGHAARGGRGSWPGSRRASWCWDDVRVYRGLIRSPAATRMQGEPPAESSVAGRVRVVLAGPGIELHEDVASTRSEGQSSNRRDRGG